MEPSPPTPPPDPACWCGHSPLAEFSPDYGRCPACGTLVVRQMRGVEVTQVRDDDRDFYGKGYYQHHLQRSYGLPDLNERARTDLPERCLFWLRTLLKYVSGPGARVLELGCGHGGFVAMLRWAGFDATGLELSPWVVEQARGWFAVPILLGPLEDQDLPEASFDAIVLMDVLEHLPDPRATMTRARRLLRPGGFLLVQTPDYPPEFPTEAAMRAAGSPFLTQLKPVEHLHLFSRESARRLMSEVGLGWVRFEPAIFAHYDMCFVAAAAPLEERLETAWPALLAADAQTAPAARAVLGMLDLDARRLAAEVACRNAEAEVSARVEELAAPAGWRKEDAEVYVEDEPPPDPWLPGHDAPGPETPAMDPETTRDLHERLLASEGERRAGRVELRRRDRELSLAHRLLARRLGADWPPPPQGVDATSVGATAGRVPLREWQEGGITFSLDQVELGPRHLVVSGWAFHAAWDAREVATLLLFQAGAGPDVLTLACPVARQDRPDVAAHFAGAPGGAPDPGGGHLEAAGFRAVILARSLPAGVPLEIFLQLEHRGEARRQETGRQLRVPPAT